MTRRPRPRYVLDASAVLALALDEPGQELVEAALARGAAISTVNLSEVYLELAKETNRTPGAVRAEVDATLPPHRLRRYAFSAAHAFDAAGIERFTRSYGLGLADRACLALGRALGARVLTTERNWPIARTAHAGLRVKVERIRPTP